MKPWHKAEVTEQWTKEQWRQWPQEGDAPRLAQISEAELVAAVMIYPQGGHSHQEGRGREVWKPGGGAVCRESGKIRGIAGPTPTQCLVNNYLNSAIKLSPVCLASSLVIILLQYLRTRPFPWAVWLRLKMFCIWTPGDSGPMTCAPRQWGLRHSLEITSYLSLQWLWTFLRKYTYKNKWTDGQLCLEYLCPVDTEHEPHI